MVIEHQTKRKSVSDSLVMEFMRPRSLNFMPKTAPKKNMPPLNEEALLKLDSHLRDQSYVYGFEFSDLDFLLSSYIDESTLSASLVNVRRWLNHIYGQDEATFRVTLPKKVKSDMLSLFGNFARLTSLLNCS